MQNFKIQKELKQPGYTDNLKNSLDKREKNLLIIKGKEINLTSLGIHFKLNQQQINALENIAQFLIDGTETAFTLSGYAGTGKSSIIKILLKWIEINFGYNYDYSVTAPTHRAKFIIESLSGKKSKTIQSILGLMPNVNVEKLDQRSLKFDLKKKAQMPKNLLIIDEASLVNKLLFKTIINQCESHGCQVLFIGDKAQLKPVGEATISQIFTIINKAELTKVERQKDGNPIGSILYNIRENILSSNPAFEFETTLNSKGEGIIFTDSSVEFLNLSVESLKNVAYYTDYLHSRVLAFTNDRVKLYNKLIRKRLNFTNEFTKGELIMAYNNVGNSEFTEGLVNSCDYIIENDIKKSSRYVGGIKFDGYEVSLISTDEKTRIYQFILSIENESDKFSALAARMEEIRMNALFEKERHKRLIAWNEYYSLSDSFLTQVPLITDAREVRKKDIDYGYSHTIHKSQGGTYQQAYVDFRDISTCKDIEQRNQLLYVGLSRCTEKAIMFY